MLASVSHAVGARKAEKFEALGEGGARESPGELAGDESTLSTPAS